MNAQLKAKAVAIANLPRYNKTKFIKLATKLGAKIATEDYLGCRDIIIDGFQIGTIWETTGIYVMPDHPVWVGGGE